VIVVALIALAMVAGARRQRAVAADAERGER
jgi:hypothetical protein